MKNLTKNTIIAILGICTISSFAFATTYSKFSSKFIKNFKDCDNYEETINSEFEGQTFTTNRKIAGWRNGFCKYEEVIKSQAGNYKLSCSFSDLQLEEIYLAMKSKSKEIEKYDLESFAEQTDSKTGKTKYISLGTSTIKGNKAYIVWAKYQNNPYFCKPQKL
jgi:hypothetical protein